MLVSVWYSPETAAISITLPLTEETNCHHLVDDRSRWSAQNFQPFESLLLRGLCLGQCCLRLDEYSLGIDHILLCRRTIGKQITRALEIGIRLGDTGL